MKRQRTGKRLLTWAFFAAVMAWWVTPVYAASATPPISVKTEKGIVFGHGLAEDGVTKVDLVMDVYSPDGDTATDKPAMVLIHGNPGKSPYPGTRLEGTGKWAPHFAERGYVCFVVAYHFFGIDEVKTAVRYVRASASKYGIDAKRIVALGHSLGGSHAITLDVTDDAPLPSPLKDDPANHAEISARVAAAVCLAGGAFEPEAFDASDGPILFIRGTADPLNEPHWRDVVVDASKKAGIPCFVYEVQGAGHGLDLEKMQVDGRSLNEIIEQFLRAHLSRGA